MIIARSKKCPRCNGINFTRVKAALWTRVLMPNTRVYMCNGCRDKVYVVKTGPESSSPGPSE